MNQDIDVHRMPPDQYIEAKNMGGGEGDLIGAKIPIKGTVQVPYTYPPGGTYAFVGSIEYKELGSTIYFIRDDSGNNYHHILLYNGFFVQRLLMGEIGLSRDYPVHAKAIIDGKLFWSDGMDFGFGTQIEGSAPKSIDIERFRPNKAIKYELVLNADAYLAGVQFFYEITDLDDNTTIGPNLLQTNGVGNRNDIMLALFNNLDSNFFVVDSFPVNTVDQPAKRIIFSYGFNQRVKITVSGGPGIPAVELNELNFYPYPYGVSTRADFVNMVKIIKPCPPCAPTVYYEKDTSLISNNIHGFSYQFRYRYGFVGNEKSAWGPASNIATNYKRLTPSGITNDPDYNKIVVTIDDDYTKAPWRWQVRKIELAFRTSRNDPWKFIESYDLYTFDVGDITIEFSDLRSRFVVPSDTDSEADVQALKNFDHVPRVALGLESVYDDQGNTILVMGGGRYDYNLSEQYAELEVLSRDLALDLPAPTSTQTVNFKSLKRGGIYRVGIAYKDWAGRQTSVVPLGTVRVPWVPADTELDDFKYYYLGVTMLTPTPGAWATYWQVMLGENDNQVDYWQGKVAQITVRDYNQATGELSTGGSTYYAFHYNMDSLSPDSTSLVTIFDQLETPNKVFVPESKDRLHVTFTGGTTWTGLTPPVQSDAEEYDYEIVGYSFEESGGSRFLIVLIELDSAISEPDWDQYSGTLNLDTEVYRPKETTNDDLYYEFGPCVKIGGSHGIVNLLGWGDTFTTEKDLYPQNSISAYERKSLHKSSSDQEWDLGRAVAYDPEYKERHLQNTLRYSDVYIPDSSENGLHSYRGGSKIQIHQATGPIRSLVYNQNVLLAIGNTKTQPIYVSRDRLMSLSGASSVGRSDQVFNIADELRLDLGCKHPESVLYEQGTTYAFDVNAGRFWRYTTGSGQFPISEYGMIGPFQAIADTFNTRPSRTYRVNCGFERRTKSLYVSSFIGFGAVFKEEENNPHWISEVTAIPQGYGMRQLDLLSFSGAQLYVHTDSAPRAYFYGSQEETTIKFVINDQVDIIKLFDSIEIHSDNKWFCSYIEVPPSPTYPGGMESRLIDNKITWYEGAGHAEFLRDLTDPADEFSSIIDPTEKEITRLLRGRELRGEVLIIELQLTNSGEEAILRGVYVYYQPSRTTVIPD